MSAKKTPIDLNDPRLRAIERQPRCNAEIVAVLKSLGRVGSKKEQDQLLAMSGIRDPFNVGTPVHVEMAGWFMDLWRKYSRPGIHLRGVHYQHVSQPNPLKHNGDPYVNVQGDWLYLCDASKYARLLGHIEINDLVDQRNPDTKIYRVKQLDWQSNPPEVTYNVFGNNTEVKGLPIIEMEPFRATIPSPHVSGYTYNDNYQPYHVEIWCEKSTMDDIIDPICQEYHINSWSGIGYSSLSKIEELLVRANDLGLPTVVFYISDLDRAGVSMPVQVARYVELWKDKLAPDISFKLVPLCLTLEQIKHYSLPSVPLKTTAKKDDGEDGKNDGDEGKKKKKKKKELTKFELLYGNRQVELDALEALHPGELKKIILEAVLPYRDLNLRSEYSDAYYEATEMVGDAWAERTKPIQDELKLIEAEVNPIIDEFQARYRDLRDEMTLRLDPYNERINSKLQAVSDMAESLGSEIDLPPKPEPKTNPPPRDWLLDTDRAWLDQLAAYKRTHSGEIEDESA
jgi:hypothetical protein